jgi:hypothetical protein
MKDRGGSQPVRAQIYLIGCFDNRTGIFLSFGLVGDIDKRTKNLIHEKERAHES